MNKEDLTEHWLEILEEISTMNIVVHRKSKRSMIEVINEIDELRAAFPDTFNRATIDRWNKITWL